MNDTIGPLDVEEEKVIKFSFADEVEAGVAITEAVVSCTVAAGTDATPELTLVGVPQIVGMEALQRVRGRVSAVTYRLRCKATDAGGLKHVQSALLEVVTL